MPSRDVTTKLVPLVHPWIDASAAPLYVVRFPIEATDDEVTRFGRVREEWAKSAAYPVSWVIDLTATKSVSASQRRIFAEHLGRFEAHDARFNQGSAIVVPNAFLRGVVTAVFWMKPSDFPNRTFETVEDARTWAAEQLRTGRARSGSHAQPRRS